MNKNDIAQVIQILREETKKFSEPIVTTISKRDKSPFKILISTILSARTKDEVTNLATERLFSLGSTPYEISKLKEEEIIKAIFPVGFYKVKAKNIINLSKILIEEYNSKVPETIEELLKLPGVGRKTANLVVTLGFGKEGICVDTHVHRISNRLGYVRTKNPKETEYALREILPKDYWIEYNDLLVTFGQNVCRPVSPKCNICKIEIYCDKVGIFKKRRKSDS